MRRPTQWEAHEERRATKCNGFTRGEGQQSRASHASVPWSCECSRVMRRAQAAAPWQKVAKNRRGRLKCYFEPNISSTIIYAPSARRFCGMGEILSLV